ncbi:MAG TPA: hypothetical protein VFK69_05835 [Candidatus Eisenbacteria bacterium]|nr:hypothetical protein [Candidatus Eisenbacteria bacterium]
MTARVASAAGVVALATVAVAGCGWLGGRTLPPAVRAEAVAALRAAPDTAWFEGSRRVGLQAVPARRMLAATPSNGALVLVIEDRGAGVGARTIVALDVDSLALRSLAAVREAACGAESARVTVGPRRVMRAVARCGTGGRIDDFLRRAGPAFVARESLPLWLRAWLPDRAPHHDLALAVLPAAFDPPPFAPAPARLRIVDGGRISVPAGAFDTWKVAVADARGADLWWFERSTPHRLVMWETANGERWRRAGVP